MSTIQHVEPVTHKYAEATIYQGVVHLSGQVPEDEACDGDIRVQTRSVLAQIDTVLARCGSSKERILRATIFLTDVKDAGGMNEEWIAWLTGCPAPARATVGTCALVVPTWRVEIVIDAASSL